MLLWNRSDSSKNTSELEADFPLSMADYSRPYAERAWSKLVALYKMAIV